MEQWHEGLGDKVGDMREHIMSGSGIHAYSFYLGDIIVLAGAASMLTLFL